MPSLEMTAIVGVVALAASVQGAVGFGSALLAAPVLVLLEPAFVPGPLIASSLVLVALIAVRDRAHAEYDMIRFSMVGNVVGALGGASVLARLDPRGFGLLFAGLVLLGVALSALGLQVRVRRSTALAAGALGGFMGATSSIGGPPMALLFQHAGAERFRGTLSAYFIASGCVSLGALAWVGRFGREELVLAAILVPAQVAGFALSLPFTRVLRGAAIRPLVLALSSLAAVTVLGRVLG